MSSTRRLVSALSAGVVSAAWLLAGSSAAPTDHGPNLWAGKWTTSNGSITLRLLDEQDVENAKTGSDRAQLWNRLPCKAGPQLYRGAYTTVHGDSGKLMFCGTATRVRGRFLSTGRFRGATGWISIRITDRDPLRYAGTSAVDGDSPDRWSGTWAGHFSGDGCCADAGGDAPLPDALVPLDSVSNGCGGGAASSDPKYGDTSSYRQDVAGGNPRFYRVTFREACKLHDAGYSGAKVKDAINGAVVDFFAWTRKQVDDKFLADMRELCERQIPVTAPDARAACRERGSTASLGAKSRYNFVRAAGSLFWKERPNLRGLWVDSKDRDAAPWAIVQTGRTVKASWTSGSGDATRRGRFAGTLISRDDDSIVMGSAKVTSDGETVRRAMRLLITAKDLDRLLMNGPGGPLTLVRRG